MTLITIPLVFLAGYLFCAYGVPFLDGLFSTFAVWFQYIQGKITVKIAADQIKVAKLKKQMEEPNENCSSRAIGFVVKEEEVEEDYDNDE